MSRRARLLSLESSMSSSTTWRTVWWSAPPSNEAEGLAPLRRREALEGGDDAALLAPVGGPLGELLEGAGGGADGVEPALFDANGHVHDLIDVLEPFRLGLFGPCFRPSSHPIPPMTDPPLPTTSTAPRPRAPLSKESRPREKPEGLPRQRRLRRTAEFGRVERQGQRAHGAYVTLIARPGRGRVGFTVSKKVGNAVVRNRVKRRLRDVARRHKQLWAKHDLVVVARPEAAGQDLSVLEADVLSVMKKLEERRNDGKPRPPR
jgi:ribonuclease P protein component